MKEMQNPNDNRKKQMLVTAAVAAVLTGGVVAAVVLMPNAEKEADQAVTGAMETIASKNASYDLSTLTENLKITDGGTYTLSGEMKDGLSVIVESDAAVEIVLNGAMINATATAAIAQTGSGALTIKIADNTENNLSDGGSSEQDACIYSEGALTIDGGNGILRVTGQQKEGEGIATEAADMTINGGVIYVDSADDGLNAGGDGGTITINGGELHINAGGDGIDSNKNAVFNGGKVYVAGSSAGGDAGIDTDGGYVVNGGLIVALGSDMLESPESNSSQYVVAMTLGTTYQEGAEIDLENSDGVAVISFDAMENFKTLVLSSDQLTTGTYTLKVNGTAVQTVTVTNKVTTVGNTMSGPQR